MISIVQMSDCSFDSFGLYRLSSLVQDHFVDLAVRISDKFNLGIDNLQEKLRLALSEDLKLRLPGSLCKQPVTLTGEGDDETGLQFVLTHIPFQDSLINGNGFLFLDLPVSQFPGVEFAPVVTDEGDDFPLVIPAEGCVHECILNQEFVLLCRS